jgi:DNA-binding transcriptional LysR family regulator
VAAAVTFARIHLMPRLPEFLDRHPDLEIDVVLDDCNVDLVGEGIDVGLRMEQLVDSSLMARRVASGSHVVVGTPTLKVVLRDWELPRIDLWAVSLADEQRPPRHAVLRSSSKR